MSNTRPVPRLFVVRHGETEWSINGRHTGRTDIPLTENGVKGVTRLAPEVVGPGKLIDPDNLCHVWVSPRKRAQKTFELLFSNLPELPSHQIVEDVAEWDYGEYEGLKPAEIKEKNPTWTIWKDGCPGGESADEMEKRVDKVIGEIHEYHRKFFEDGEGRRDAMIVSHGHFSRCLISRWVEFPLCLGTHFNVEPAGITLLTYNHRSLKEPAMTGLNLHAF